MAEKEYIDREAVLSKFLEYGIGWGAAKVKGVINSIPAADVRPVVLCQDCKHFQVNVSPSGYLPQGVPEWECRYWLWPTAPTNFCSYGEKMEES